MVKKEQNCVHVVNECPLRQKYILASLVSMQFVVDCKNQFKKTINFRGNKLHFGIMLTDFTWLSTISYISRNQKKEWVSIKSNYDEDGKRKSCNDNCVNGHYSTKKAAENVTFYILDASGH